MNEIRVSPGRFDSWELLVEMLGFENIWSDGIDIWYYRDMIVALTSQVCNNLAAREKQENHFAGARGEPWWSYRLASVLDSFYIDLMFSGAQDGMGRQFKHTELNCLSYLLDYRTGDIFSMTALLNYVLCANGFNSQIAVVNQDMMLRVSLPFQSALFIDPMTGESYCFDHRYEGRSNDTSNGYSNADMGSASVLTPVTSSALRSALRSSSCSGLILGVNAVLPRGDESDFHLMNQDMWTRLYLTRQKMAFIDAGNYSKALGCIDCLLSLEPNNPYQRRDRGFLLHQLDCFTSARNDFEFFIDQCPEDPGVNVLKRQIEAFDGLEQTVH